MQTQERKYGLSLQAPSHQTLTALAPMKFPSPGKAASLAETVDLRPHLPPVYDQGHLGSCTANALCCLMQVLDGTPGSRLFLYFNERALEGTTALDAGGTLADGVRSLKTQGVCPEASWPYVPAQFARKPPPPCYANALKHEALSVYAVPLVLNSLKAALSGGHPIAMGIKVFASFESASVAKSGNVSLPKKGEALLGGHAIVVVGYSDLTQAFLVRNSWGTMWGIKGYFTIPYAYLTDATLASDAWVIVSAS